MNTFTSFGTVGAKGKDKRSAGIVVQFRGLDQLMKMFDRLTPEMARSIDMWANKSLYKVQREAQLETPVDTGTLLNSIYTSPKGLIRGFVSTNTDYALFVHEGHKVGGSGRKIPANRFMERGLKNSEAYMDAKLDEVITNVIKNL
jgi:hypothetical protein